MGTQTVRLGFVALLVLGAAATPAAGPTARPAPTFTRDIAPDHSGEM